MFQLGNMYLLRSPVQATEQGKAALGAPELHLRRGVGPDQPSPKVLSSRLGLPISAKLKRVPRLKTRQNK